jgi:hypothetical protein
MNLDEGNVVPEQEPAPTEDAQKEALAISHGSLRRDESIRTHIHLAGLVLFWMFVFVMISLTLVWAWHLGAPERWRFLTSEQRQDLQMALLSAAGSSYITQVSKRWISPKS